MPSTLPISVSLVIPLCNNAQTLKNQITLCLKFLTKHIRTFEILICEDKSTDNSALLLKKYFGKDTRVRLLFHTHNMGIAPTVRELYEKGRYEYIFLYSADGDWDPQDIPVLIRLLYQKHADIAIGKRDKSIYSPYRKFVSACYRLFTKLFFGVDTIDAGSIKVFKKDLLLALPIKSRSLFMDAELIIKAVKRGYTVVWCPVGFHKKDGGAGKGANLSNILSTMYDLSVLRLQRL